ncbi:MAG: secretin N-terminal domain-containing protein [Burkholderiales bacterium]
MQKRILSRIVGAFALLLALAATGAVAQTQMEVITLRYRTADQIIPSLQPFLDRSGTLSGYQNQLIVRTTPQNLAELRQILATLDATPRRLQITVAQDADVLRERSVAEASGSFGGDRGRVTVPPEPGRPSGLIVQGGSGDDRFRARVDSSVSTGAQRGTQTVQVLEGNEAMIRVGQAAPVPTRSVRRTVVNGQVVEQVVDSAQYVEANTGFRVRPRVSGSQVTLEIMPQAESFSARQPGVVNVQSASTVVSGRLGEWIEVGGSSTQASDRQSGLASRRESAGQDSRRIFLKVDEVR